MWVSAHFFIAPLGCDGMVATPTKEDNVINKKDGADFWVLFPATGQRYPILYTNTLDQYEVALPAGIYSGIYLADLKQELRADFHTNARIVSK
jgi:hypothetical protein